MTGALAIRVARPLPPEAVLVQPAAQRPRRDGAPEPLRTVGGQQLHGPRGRPVATPPRVTAEDRRQPAGADVGARRPAVALGVGESVRVPRRHVGRHPAVDRGAVDAELTRTLGDRSPVGDGQHGRDAAIDACVRRAAQRPHQPASIHRSERIGKVRRSGHTPSVSQSAHLLQDFWLPT